MRTFSVLALFLAAAWLFVGVGVRILLQRRSTGDVRIRVRAGSAGALQPWAILLQGWARLAWASRPRSPTWPDWP